MRGHEESVPRSRREADERGETARTLLDVEGEHELLHLVIHARAEDAGGDPNGGVDPARSVVHVRHPERLSDRDRSTRSLPSDRGVARSDRDRAHLGHPVAEVELEPESATVVVHDSDDELERSLCPRDRNSL